MKITTLMSHLLVAASLTAIILLIYIVMQQNYRMNANDPQIQMAQDIRNGLEAGQDVQSFYPPGQIDVAESLSPFVCLTDHNGQLLNSTATLDKVPIHLPKGVLDHVNKYGEERVTWQPRNGVRIALVVDKVNTSHVGYVAAGRSLLETEERISNLGWMCLIVWVVCMGAVAMNFIMMILANQKKSAYTKN